MAKIFGDLEEKVRRFGENVWRNTLAIWRKRVRRLGESVIGDFRRKCFGDLERSFGDNFGGLEKPIRRNSGWRFGEIVR